MDKIQIRLWEDCYNNCAFCSVENKHFTTIETKNSRIKKLLELPYCHKYGIIGGEFFEGQLKGCEDNWLNMIQNIKCDELFISANLINDQYLLKETLSIRPNILICTSYDTIGRFKSEDKKHIWLDRVKEFNGHIACTIILTQDIFTDPLIPIIVQHANVNLIEPFLGQDWVYNVDKKTYHEHLIKENKIFNLPKRNDFLNWITNPIYSTILANMQNYKTNHFGTLMFFDDNNNLYSRNRFINDEYLDKCGHPYTSKCYADSENCVACDLEEL